jgi:hypothetical protein
MADKQSAADVSVTICYGDGGAQVFMSASEMNDLFARALTPPKVSLDLDQI